MDKDRYRVGETHISITNPTDAQSKITAKALSGKGGFVCVTNMRMIRYADKHPEYAELMEKSFMNLPDGMPLTWCGRLWGINQVSRICGPDLFENMLSDDTIRIKHFLLGDMQNVLDSIVEKYNVDGKMKIVGAYSLPFANINDFDYVSIAKMVMESGANLIWTAMTAPKQDEFNARLLKLTPNVVLIGVGRAFRASIGEYKKVPDLAKKMGLSGFWLMKGTWRQEIRFYVETFFFLLKIIFKILWKRICGEQYYE